MGANGTRPRKNHVATQLEKNDGFKPSQTNLKENPIRCLTMQL